MDELNYLNLNGVEYTFGGSGGGPVVSYTVTNNLHNVTNSNGATTAREGKPYNALLGLAEGAELDSISVKMGGVDITATAWNPSAMSISIESVTGDIVITAKAYIVIRQTVTWSGSGSDKSTGSSPYIDATNFDLYWEIPYVEGATQLASGATAESNAMKGRASLYTYDESTGTYTWVGYYFIDTQEISTSSRTGENRPAITFDSRVLVAPAGYFVDLQWVNNCSAFTSNSACTKYLNDHANVVELVEHVDEDDDDDEPITNAQATENDLLMMYRSVPLATEISSDPTTYEGVIEEAKNAWFHEYSGDINRIPLICHADQHDTMSGDSAKAMWDAIDNMISWYDVSKVINFGDTTNSYNNYDDPTLGDSNLEDYLAATENVPFSKRIEIFGNHDCMKIIDASLTYIKQEPSYLNPYFKNVMARRTSNNGYHVTYDPYFNVKYIVYSSYDYQDASHYNIVSSGQYDFLIEEMSKNDGYDIIMCGHQDASLYQEYVGTLITARLNKTSGTFTDRAGQSHSYDFTGCENDLLVCLHGHSHSDGYNYDMGVLSQCFDNYYDSTRPIFFVIVDRTARQLKAWKVTNTPEYTTYTRPFDEPNE